MTANRELWIIANLLPAISSGRTERPGPGASGGYLEHPPAMGMGTLGDRHLRLEKWGPA